MTYFEEDIKMMISPGWCGLVDRVLACKPKGCSFDSQPGHMPGLQAGPPMGGAREATTQRCFSPSLSPSCPLSLKITKSIKSLKKRMINLFGTQNHVETKRNEITFTRKQMSKSINLCLINSYY